MSFIFEILRHKIFPKVTINLIKLLFLIIIAILGNPAYAGYYAPDPNPIRGSAWTFGGVAKVFTGNIAYGAYKASMSFGSTTAPGSISGSVELHFKWIPSNPYDAPPANVIAETNGGGSLWAESEGAATAITSLKVNDTSATPLNNEWTSGGGTGVGATPLVRHTTSSLSLYTSLKSETLEGSDDLIVTIPISGTAQGNKSAYGDSWVSVYLSYPSVYVSPSVPIEDGFTTIAGAPLQIGISIIGVNAYQYGKSAASSFQWNVGGDYGVDMAKSYSIAPDSSHTDIDSGYSIIKDPDYASQFLSTHLSGEGLLSVSCTWRPNANAKFEIPVAVLVQSPKLKLLLESEIGQPTLKRRPEPVPNGQLIPFIILQIDPTPGVTSVGVRVRAVYDDPPALATIYPNHHYIMRDLQLATLNYEELDANGVSQIPSTFNNHQFGLDGLYPYMPYRNPIESDGATWYEFVDTPRIYLNNSFSYIRLAGDFEHIMMCQCPLYSCIPTPVNSQSWSLFGETTSDFAGLWTLNSNTVRASLDSPPRKRAVIPTWHVRVNP